MSTVGAGTGKERSAAINFWILLLIVALIALITNAYLSADYAEEESSARDLVADIMVLSQQNAKFSQDAVSGGLEAFDELESTRLDIQSNIDHLSAGDGANLNGYATSPEIGPTLAKLKETWAPINEASQRILASKEMVLGLNDTAAAFSANVPQLQAYMDEVVRAMGESGAASSQIYTAVRQIVLADRMLRRVTQILQGGAGALSASGSFSRDATMFGQVLGGLQNGLPEQNIRRIDSPAARDPLAKVAELYASVQTDVDTILNASTELFEVKEAADQIFTSSNDLLEDARTLNQSLINLPSTRTFPNTYIGIVAGALAILGILGLLFTLYRDQVKRFARHAGIEPAQPGSHSAPARRNGIARGRRPDGPSDGDRRHHRRDRGLDQLRGRGAALPRYDH
jgi:twitching motility protein PilJ